MWLHMFPQYIVPVILGSLSGLSFTAIGYYLGLRQGRHLLAVYKEAEAKSPPCWVKGHIDRELKP